MSIKVNCPNCQREIEWNNSAEFRPFCSKRCQLTDLGEWVEENNCISEPVYDPHLVESLYEEY